MSAIRNGELSSTLSWFDRIAKSAERTVGHPIAFIGGVAVIIIWLLSGPLFGFSDTWQLIINTATTIVTYGFFDSKYSESNHGGSTVESR
jgi:Low affinity iron permease